MANKNIMWGLGGALVLILGVFSFYAVLQDQTALAPTNSDEKIGQESSASATADQSAVMKTAPKSDVSLDEIMKSIESDMSFDQQAMNNESSAELNSVSEGNATINDLGQTYDESVY